MRWVVLAVIGFTSTTYAQTTVFVDADAPSGGDGSSWERAYNDLQDALADARGDESVNQIWVAEGTYQPDRGTGARDMSYELVSRVELLGGFSGDEENADQRDPDAHVTVLSGDLRGDDEDRFDDNEDNSFVIVLASETATGTVIDGFVVTGAHNQAQIPIGGAINVQNSSLVVRRTKATKNVSEGSGAGIFVSEGSDLALEQSEISDNTAFNGAGMFVNRGSARASDSLIARNITAFPDPNRGCAGGIQCLRGELELVRCRVEENDSLCGGGVSAVLATRMVMIDTDFVGNRGDRLGGGLRLERSDDNDAQPAIIHGCRFIGNSNVTQTSGGSAIFSSETLLDVRNCQFMVNESRQTIATVDVRREIGHIFENCVFSGNVAEAKAGISLFRCSATVTNCTFANNLSLRAFTGAAIFIQSSTLHTNNSVFWGNARTVGEELVMDQLAQIDLDETSDVLFEFCTVQDLVGGGHMGAGNIDDDPRFVDADGLDDVVGTADDNLRLTQGSPAIDAGNNFAVPDELDTDLDGLPRFVDDPEVEDTGRGDPPIVDMGPYESQGGGCVRDPQWLCDGDADGAGQVNPVDVGLVQSAFGSTNEQDLCNYDVDCDGQINPVDSGIVQSLFGTCDAPRAACP